MSIMLTETAAREVQGIIARRREEGPDGGKESAPVYLRLAVEGGGCSGLSYSLDLVETKTEEDEVSTEHGIEIICDPKSLPHLDGTTVDFKDELTRRGFVFNNPNATGGCGCGSSFSA